MKKLNLLLIIVSFSYVFTSCDDSDDIEEIKKSLTISTTYDSSSYKTNTIDIYQLRSNYAALFKEIGNARKGQATTAAKLSEMFKAGTASLFSFSGASLSSEIELIFKDIEEATDTTQTINGNTSIGINGGVISNNIYNENGTDLKEAVEKALMSGMMFPKGISYLSNPSLVSLDKALAVFGSNPTFPNTNSSKAAKPDAWIAVYGARRTPASGGLYTEIRDAFLKAQSAIKAGNKYNQERDEAIAKIKLKWEEIIAATVINYLYGTEGYFTTTGAKASILSSGLHSLGESIGLIKGLKSITDKKITESQITEILDLMNQSKPIKVINQPTEIAKLGQARTRLQSVYGFTEAQMNSFKNNYVSLENR